LRPPLAQDRLCVSAEGEIWLTLGHRWADGTTHLRFDPLELLERLAVLTPRPRVNLILYYGVLAPRAAWRAAIVAAASADAAGWIPRRLTTWITPTARRAVRVRLDYQWAELMRRTLGSTCWRARGAVGGCVLWG
jgi:hypothetical protein